MLGKDEPALWYEAAAGLPKVEGSKPALSADDSEVLRTRAEQLLEREAQVFEREVQGRNAADARWLSQVRGRPRGGRVLCVWCCKAGLVVQRGWQGSDAADAVLGTSAIQSDVLCKVIQNPLDGHIQLSETPRIPPPSCAPLPLQVRRSGTTADKVAAMTLMVGSSATGGLKSLDGLMAMMGKSGGGKQVVLAAMEALQELFMSSLLPDRKLRVLEQQPLQVRGAAGCVCWHGRCNGGCKGVPWARLGVSSRAKI